MTDFLTYEQPLNERIRTFLRLESLFNQFTFHVNHGTAWDNPIAIDALKEQAAEQGLSDFGRVICLGGQDYRKVVEAVFDQDTQTESG